MRKYLVAIAVLATLGIPASAQPPSAAKNEGLQHAGERHERRCPEAVHEHLPKRRRCRSERTALHQGKAVRQFLHRHGQGLPQVGVRPRQPARMHQIV